MIQSIASVIQALPPDEEIPPIEVRVTPFYLSLFQDLTKVVPGHRESDRAETRRGTAVLHHSNLTYSHHCHSALRILVFM